MYKKKTIRKLAVFFAFLLALVVVVLLTDQKKEKEPSAPIFLQPIQPI